MEMHMFAPLKAPHLSVVASVVSVASVVPSVPSLLVQGLTPPRISRVGQNHIYTVYIRYFWLGNHQMYGHIRRTYTVLTNPTHFPIMH